MRKYLFPAILIFFICIMQSKAQLDTTNLMRKDSVCFKYNFQQGDTLFYYVVSFDSLIINNETPLLKRRFEKIKIVSDSITSSGRYHLTQVLVDFIGKESKGDIKNVERDETPWLNRKVWYEIDSVGKRYAYGLDDSTKGAISPGGAFMPQLIMHIGESSKAINESWIVQSLDDLPENGIPVPLLRQSLLMRARDPIDTLDDHCNAFEFIQTGQGSIELINGKTGLTVTTIINGNGKMLMSKEKNIPVHLFATTEQKLTLKYSNGTVQSGLQYINANYTLDSIHHFKKPEPAREKSVKGMVKSKPAPHKKK